jgi:RNA recognition motif-containing protein
MNIYVGNLSPETSVLELRGCFEPFGAVEDVTISAYKVRGVPKGFGQVEMPSADHAQAAIIGLQGKELAGNLLKVQEE